jgi:proton-dependent oligopeptide transporter, POT family
LDFCDYTIKNGEASMILQLLSIEQTPARLTALMMGRRLLVASIGNKLCGELTSLWDGYEHKVNFFWVNCTLAPGTSVIILSIIKWLNKIMNEDKV